MAIFEISGLRLDELAELYSTKQEAHEPHRSSEEHLQSINILAQSCDKIVLIN